MTPNTQELLAQLQTVHATQANTAGEEKLTPTQKKHLFIEELSQAITSQDPEAVKDTLDRFKIALPHASIRTMLLQNFNQEIADLLVERGLKVEGRFYTLGQECKTPEAMKFLLQTSAWGNPNKFDQNHYDNLTDEHQKNQYLLYFGSFNPEVISIYQQNIVSSPKATSKERANHAGIRKAILEKFPELLNLMIVGGNSWFLTNCLEDYKNMKEDLQSISKENLPTLITTINGYDRFTPNQLFNFFKLLKDFDLEACFHDHVSSIEHTRLQASLIQEEWLSGDTLFDTKLYKEASQVKVNLRHSGFYYQGASPTPPTTLAEWLEQGMIAHQWVAGGFQEKVMFVMLHNTHHNHGVREGFDKLFDLNVLLKAQQLTPWEVLLGNSHVIGILAQTNLGKKMIENNLSSLGAENFASLSVLSFKQVMGEMPSLYEWRDGKGNSLMHLVANRNSSKQAAETFVRMSRDLITEPNHEGLSPLDLMLKAGMKENVYATLQKSLMKKTLRSSDSEGGVKARAIKKHSSGPRRM